MPFRQEIIKAKDDTPLNISLAGNVTETVHLKENYNSIDLTEVEQINEDYDDTNGSYRPEIGPVLSEVRKKIITHIGVVNKKKSMFQLRRLALTHKFEKMLNVSVKFHFDKMRRVSEEKYDYYFAPLHSTPFTLGLAIPSTYGQTLIKVRDEIHSNIKSGFNMTELFLGQNWKVHPDW